MEAKARIAVGRGQPREQVKPTRSGSPTRPADRSKSFPVEKFRAEMGRGVRVSLMSKRGGQTVNSGDCCVRRPDQRNVLSTTL